MSERDAIPEASWTCGVNGDACIGPDCPYAFRHEVVYVQPVVPPSEPEARDRWRYEDSRLFCNDQYVAALEPTDGDESTCEYIAKTLDDYGRAIADYEDEIASLREEYRKAERERIIGIIERLGDGYENQHGKEREVIDDVLYEIRGGQHE